MRLRTIKANAEEARSWAATEPEDPGFWLDVAELWDKAAQTTEVARKAVEAATMAHEAAKHGVRVRS